MSAYATSTSEKLIEAKPRWSGQIGSGGVADGTTTTIPLASATNLDNGDIYIFTINRVNSTSVKQDTWEVAIGELSGTNFINCVRRVEGNATAATSWAAGTVVEILFTAKHWNNMIDFLGVSFQSDGTPIADLPLTTPKITTGIKDVNGNELIKATATASAVNEVTVANAATGNAPVVSATGDDTNISIKQKGKGTGVIQNDGDTVELIVFDFTTSVATGDGKAYVTIPTKLNGMNLDKVHARVITAGTTGTTDIQIHNVTDTVDMLSTKLTIDSGETGSDTAATAAVIDTTKDDVATNDLLRIDIDAVSTTAPKGLILRLEFRNA